MEKIRDQRSRLQATARKKRISRGHSCRRGRRPRPARERLPSRPVEKGAVNARAYNAAAAHGGTDFAVDLLLAQNSKSLGLSRIACQATAFGGAAQPRP